MEEDQEYEVIPSGAGFEVVSPGGTSVLVTPDENNARHYATLLTAAWRAGYKQGYRAAREDL